MGQRQAEACAWRIITSEKRIVVRMYRRGKSMEDIAQDTDISIEAVREMLKAEGPLN